MALGIQKRHLHLILYYYFDAFTNPFISKYTFVRAEKPEVIFMYNLRCFLYEGVFCRAMIFFQSYVGFWKFFFLLYNTKLYWKWTEELMQDNKTKSVIEFDSGCTIKSAAIKTNPSVKITTCFMNGKRLMLAKTSIISFAYDMINIFCFPEDNKVMQPIYDKHKIEKCLVYQNLTDTESTSLFFVFICGLSSHLNKKIQEMLYLREWLTEKYLKD